MKKELIFLLLFIFMFRGKSFCINKGNPNHFCIQDLVVKITDEKGYRIGAGITIGRLKSEVFILTALHVIKKRNCNYKIGFYQNSRLFDCKVYEKASNDLDFGLIIIDLKDIEILSPKFKIGDSQKLTSGLPIVAIGHPFDKEWYINKNQNFIIDSEMVEGDSRKFSISNNGIIDGYSGGPIFNESLEMIGMISKRTPLGIAIKISEIMKLLKRWRIPINFIEDNQSIPIMKDEMVLIPSGTFIMGITEDEISSLLKNNSSLNREDIVDEMPGRKVEIDSFYMDKYEVTNLQYARFLNEWGKDTDEKGNKMIFEYKWGLQKVGDKWSPQKGYESYPVVFVTWYGANQYAKWAGKRLPSEAEWEYAAEGNCQLEYATSTGKIQPHLANYFDSKVFHTLSVDKYSPNAFGLKNLSGNVWEWCADFYDLYSGDTQTELENECSKKFANYYYRVLRGGAWNSKRLMLRNTKRHKDEPAEYSRMYGFRCVKDLNRR